MDLKIYINSYKKEFNKIAIDFNISDERAERLFYELAEKYYAISRGLENTDDEIALEEFIESYHG